MPTYHSYNFYTGDGVTEQFAVNFTLGFLSRTHVYCFVSGELDGSQEQIYRTLTWINDGLVDIGDPAADGSVVTIQRITPNDVLIHDYNDGASIIELNLDESNLQALMISQEAMDYVNYILPSTIFQKFEVEFNSTDLVDDVFTYTHGVSATASNVMVYDENGIWVPVPDGIDISVEGKISIDLISYTVGLDMWKVVITI